LLEGAHRVLKPTRFFGEQLPPEKFIQGVPRIDSVVENAACKSVVPSHDGRDLRPYGTATGVPGDRVAALRDAFKRTLAEPEFVPEATRAGMLVVHNSGAKATLRGANDPCTAGGHHRTAAGPRTALKIPDSRQDRADNATDHSEYR
jgi:hypothetical protein